jgi:hypothetical protein
MVMQIKILTMFGFMVFTVLAQRIEAQAVTIQNEPAKVSYYRMPDQPLDPGFTTYSADIEISFHEFSKTGLTEGHIRDNYLRLEGYREVSSKGDVEITVEVGNFMIWNESRGTTRTKSKNKDGVQQTRIRYHIEVRYSMPMTLYVYNRKGVKLMDQYVLSNGSIQSWTSPSYDSASELESYWRVQRKSKLEQLQKDYMVKGLKMVSDEINNRFGYRRIDDNVRFETIGKKKHPLYEEYQRHVEIIQAAFKLMDADKGLNEIRSRIKPALEFYKKQALQIKSNSKDDTRLRHICLYNQALAHYWMEEFEPAQQLVDEMLRRDGKDKDAKRLNEDISYTVASLSAADRKSRHQVVVGGKS